MHAGKARLLYAFMIDTDMLGAKCLEVLMSSAQPVAVCNANLEAAEAGYAAEAPIGFLRVSQTVREETEIFSRENGQGANARFNADLQLKPPKTAKNFKFSLVSSTNAR